VTSAIRVLLVDDHVLFRSAIRALLRRETGIEVVGESPAGDEAVSLAEELDPHVVVMEIAPDDAAGLAATGRIIDRCPDSQVLVLTVRRPEETLESAIEAGARGYLTKDRAEDELFRAIRVLARDEVYLQGRATGLLLDRYRGGAPEPADARLDDLSDREREVLVLTALGYSGTEIGDRLSISAKTVDTYRARIRRKLGVDSVPELVRAALQAGLLDGLGDAGDAAGTG
jgi:two-component system response regulator NreC